LVLERSSRAGSLEVWLAGTQLHQFQGTSDQRCALDWQVCQRRPRTEGRALARRRRDGKAVGGAEATRALHERLTLGHRQLKRLGEPLGDLLGRATLVLLDLLDR
jgi:hypothetical protein